MEKDKINSNRYLFTKAKGVRKYSGSHQSGKTSAARLESMLIYGNDDVTSSTASANYSEGSKSPLLVEDNLETDQMADSIIREFRNKN
ncbi:MAG: hypothetical protein KJ737_19495 [Proteobacteria bacterium]|nr:hypothetical protein [Pseudomonadota bacterium]